MHSKILLVDDEPEIVELIKNRLEAENFDVIIAFNGEDGIKKAWDEKPDLIILDIMLPDKGGYEVCAELKHGDSPLGIPILMLSAKVGYLNKKLAIQCGADSYLPKPYTHEYLLEEIEKILPPASNTN